MYRIFGICGKMKPVGFKGLNVGNARFSQETKNILNEICAASHLSTARSRHMLNCLNDGGKSEDPLDHFHYEDLINSKVEARYRRSTSASGPKGRMNKQEIKACHTSISQRRKKPDIEASGCYRRDEYKPPKKKEISDKEKEVLTFRMAYGRNPPCLPDVAEIFRKRLESQGSAKQEATPLERFKELYDEVSERKEFMEEARLLGISSCYEAALNCEIAQKIKEMESIEH